MGCSYKLYLGEKYSDKTTHIKYEKDEKKDSDHYEKRCHNIFQNIKCNIRLNPFLIEFIQDMEKYFLKKYLEIQKKYVKKHETSETKKISNEIKDEIMKHQSALNVRDCATKEIN